MRDFKKSDESTVSRRTFLSMSGIGAAGIALASNMTVAHAAEETAAESGAPSFLLAPEPISDDQISETMEYDVVVIGAGTSGVPAAMAARKEGARVAVLQKVGAAVAQGGSAACFLHDKSDDTGIQEVLSELVKENQYRTNRKLLQVWADRGEEAIMYVLNRSQEFEGDKHWHTVREGNLASTDEHPAYWYTIRYSEPPEGNAEGIGVLAKLAEEKDGVEFFYNTPAQQLVVEDGRVTGVIALNENDQYVRFTATKGVILATGDYQNDDEMMRYYCPDAADLGKKQIGKTGDGHKMGLWVGAQMEPVPHTKMVHDFSAGPMFNEPFLSVDQDGNRFCDETVDMSYKCNFVKSGPNAGYYTQIFDASYEQQVSDWGGKPTPADALEKYMPEVDGDKSGVAADINTFKADSIEELAEKLGIDPEALQTTVDAYNTLCENGCDSQFGKSAKYLQPVTTPPFYGIHRYLRVSAMCSGLIIDEQARVLDANGEPIPGLWAAGNVTGEFYGGVDYPLFVNGLSVGRCFTFGYIAGENAARA